MGLENSGSSTPPGDGAPPPERDGVGNEDDSGPGSVTRLVNRLAAGELASQDAVFPVVYDELRRIAAGKLRPGAPGERNGQLRPTELVHEAFVKLFGHRPGAWENRAHFYGSAARAMQQVLIDAARSGKPRGGRVESLADPDGIGGEPAAEDESSAVDVLTLSGALQDLEKLDPGLAELARLRLFAGLSVDAAAEALECSARTARRDWSVAKAWLMRRMRDRAGG